MKKACVTMIVAAMAMSINALAVECIVNGDFETPLVGTGWRAPSLDFDLFLPGEVPGWTIEVFGDGGGPDGPELEFWSDLGPMPVAGVSAYSCNQCVELDGFDPTKISQIVVTIPGVRYELSYAWRPRPDVSCAMDVLVDQVVVVSHSGSTGNWQLETYAFTASSENTTIAFAETGIDDQLGMLLDAVSLVNLDPLGFDSATGYGERIRSKGNWFMYNEYLGDGVTYDIQAGNPKGGTNIIGRYWVDNMGSGNYRASYDIDDTIEIDGIVYDIVVTEEHLAIGNSPGDFTAKPGRDDNADFNDGEGDTELFYDEDGDFYIFAHFSVEYY